MWHLLCNFSNEKQYDGLAGNLISHFKQKLLRIFDHLSSKLYFRFVVCSAQLKYLHAMNFLF